MKALVFISLILVAALATPLHEQLIKDLYTQWKSTHKKAYTTEYENTVRFQIFSKNYLQILKFNKEQSDVVLGLNQFADLTSEEFGALHTGLTPKTSNNNAKVASFQTPKDLPVSVDWRTKGAVTDVKNQGSCGSCWAFSATGALEGFYFINNAKLVSFSEQNLVDCVTADQGCNGGLPSDAFAYTAQGGIETEADYPYKGVDQKCAFDASKAIKTNPGGYANVTANNVTAMKTAIVNQPVSVGIQANQIVFQFYIKGVIKRLCGANLDHGVLVVGYDTSQGPEAFIVKNSWGGSWGVNGYVYISTDDSANKGAGVCGILSMATVPTN
jgi:xylem cysteine proteinase